MGRITVAHWYRPDDVVRTTEIKRTVMRFNRMLGRGRTLALPIYVQMLTDERGRGMRMLNSGEQDRIFWISQPVKCPRCPPY